MVDVRFQRLADPGRHLTAWTGGSKPTPTKPVRLHFCPYPCKAAFMITDHGDRTRTSILRALYMGHSDPKHPEYGSRGIVSSGIKITQGVMYKGWDGFDYLENPQFFSLMKEIHTRGMEVCPHNTCDHLGIRPEDTRKHLEFYAKEFGLASWIDHYRLPSNLTQDGINPDSPYYILDQFRHHGGYIAWSFVDKFSNPPSSEIDVFRPPSYLSYLDRALRECGRALRACRLTPRARSSLGALLLRTLGHSFMGNLTVLRHAPNQIGLAKYLNNVFHLVPNALRYALRRAIDSKVQMFPLRWDSTNGIYWFNTVRVLFISEAYTPLALSRLVENTGIHIGHTYLGFYSSRYDDCAFGPTKDGQWRTCDSFEEFLKELANHKRQGRIWNPTLRDFAQFHLHLSQVRFQRIDNMKWKLLHEGSIPIKGLTVRARMPLIVTGSSHYDQCQHESEFWYGLTLHPGQIVVLEIKEPGTDKTASAA